jgi:hemolysin activation/secretion protein
VTPTPSKAVPYTVPSTLKVERFEVVGSTVFSPETLAKQLAPFTKRPISYAELLEARSAVTQLYVDEGYTTSGAFIPPQALEGGIVKIQVLEGGLEAIDVTGNKRLNSSYVRKRLQEATSKPLNTRRLLEALQLLQLNPLIENLSAELSTGARPGTSLLQVRVTEAQTSGLQFATNNGRSPSVGSLRQQLQFTEANLLGLGDDLSLAYAHTSGSDAFDVNYTLPINSRNGTISLGYGTTSSNVIEAPFDELDIEAESRYYDLTLRQPLIQTPSKELTLGLQAVRQESETSLLDTPFPLSLGADARGDTRISAVRFFQEWTSRNSREVVAARSQFSFGVGAFNATVNDDAPDSHFFAWRGQAQWLRLLAPDTVLLVRGDVQLAGSPLVPLEQFGLGGQASVRGYRQDAYLSDSGVFASAELRLPILRLGSRQSVLQLIPFVDVGTVWNNSGRYDPDPSTLASVGLGLQWQPSDLFSVRVDWGIPLVSIPSSDRTWQENGLYFSVNYTPF